MDQDQPTGFHQTILGPLPQEWGVVQLGDLFSADDLLVQYGFAQGQHNQTGAGIPHLRPFNVTTAGRIDLSQIKYVAPPSDGSPYWVEPGDIIFNNTNSEELVGKTAFFPFSGKFVLSNHMTILRVLNENMLDAFWLSQELLYLWQHRFFQALCRRHVNQASVSLARLQGVAIPLPPLPEQRAIAGVLRTVQRAIAATEQVIAAARELKRALMRHLFTYGPVAVGEVGQVALRETEIGLVPEGWEVVHIAEIATVKGGKRLPKGHNFSEPPTTFPYIRVTDFENWTVNIAGLKSLTLEDHNRLWRYVISSEDVYISIAGTIGLVGTVPQCLNGANLTENAARIVIRKGIMVDKNYLVAFLASEGGQQQISRFTSKTSQPKLALARIQQVVVPLPPLARQREIAHILAAVDRKIATEGARQLALEDLFKTLLRHLMTGRVRVPVENDKPVGAGLVAALDRASTRPAPDRAGTRPAPTRPNLSLNQEDA